jgi:hypothetical protein
MMNDISRRDFLKYVGAGAAGLLAARARALGIGKDSFPLDPSTVVECFHESATSGSTINETIVQMMVDESVKSLTGITDVGEAWKSLFPGISQSSVIGIKVNCINYRLSTHPEVTRCIVNGLGRMQVGGSPFRRNNIIVWDRTTYELTNAGYTIYTGSDPDTFRCFSTGESGVGYDNTNPLNVAGSTQNPSKIISQLCEFIINAAVLKTHSQGAVTLCLKNHYGSVHSPGSLSHTSHCTPSVPALNAQIRDVLVPTDKVKVFFIDGLFGLYSGGPGGSPNFNPKVTVMSKDPVACDYHGQAVINIERQNRSLTPVNCQHITMAAGAPYNLGTTDINLIQLRNVGLGGSGVARAATGLGASPDPFRGSTTVRFALARAATVEVDLVDRSGRSVAKVFHGRLQAGGHRVGFKAGRLAAGGYLLRLRDGARILTRPVTVLN